jgi:hypothetical protein
LEKVWGPLKTILIFSDYLADSPLFRIRMIVQSYPDVIQHAEERKDSKPEPRGVKGKKDKVVISDDDFPGL